MRTILKWSALTVALESPQTRLSSMRTWQRKRPPMLKVIEAIVLSVLTLLSLSLSVLMPMMAWAVYKDMRDRGGR